MLRVMAEGRRVPLYVDEIRQPIWVTDLATAILELAEGDLTGILNVAGPQSLSRWEYGTALLAALGVDASQAAVLVRAAEVAPDRPRDCTLDLTKANRTLVTRIRPMKKALSLDVRETH
jgi:dTDP-4-dehydrorhamnose reductase